MQHQGLQEVQLFSYNNLILPSSPCDTLRSATKEKNTVETVMFKKTEEAHNFIETLVP